MKPLRLAALLAAVLSGFATPAVAQTIGVPPTANAPAAPADKPLIVPSMIVVNARGASLKDGRLVLEGVAPVAIVFADRPVRAAGHARIVRLIEEWGDYEPDSFTRVPPNGTISVLKKATSTLAYAVVTLKGVKYEGNQLSFDATVLGGDLTGADGPASLFLDIVHLPIRQGMAAHTAWYTSVR